MSVLSEKEIINELGKGILFHPLKRGSIRSCNLCLTASEYNYALGKKEPLKIHEDLGKKYFYLPPRDTVLVWTDESIWLSNSFCASIHSTVNIVSKGIGHLGTRINPNWSGVLCITFHNLSDQEVIINIQDEENPIAYLIIHKLTSKSLDKGNIDGGARLDVIEGLQNTQKIYDYYQRGENRWMRDNIKLLKEKMLQNDEYARVKYNWWERLGRDIFSDLKSILLFAGGLISTIATLLIKFSGNNDSIILYAIIIAGIVFIVYVVIIILQLVYLIRKNIKVEQSNSNE